MMKLKIQGPEKRPSGIVLLIVIIKFILILTLIAGSYSAESPLKEKDLFFRTTYETAILPGNEKMGLLGLNYLISFTPWLYSGLGVYSAEYGERGGFFTGGLDTGVIFNIYSGLNFNSGIFAGGGGGGAAPQGGGLMFRPYCGLFYDFSVIKLGAGISRNIFPNGDIDSTQGYIQADFPFSILLASRSSSGSIDLSGDDISSRSISRHRLNIIYQTYFPAGTVKTTEGVKPEKSYSQAGISWSRETDTPFFIYFQSAGAMAGESDGYAELFFGTGLRYYITENIGCEIKGSAGGAGGGRVDTGGGFIYKGNAGGFVLLPGGIVFSAEGLYVNAPSGSFKGTGFVFALGADLDILSPGPGISAPSENDSFSSGRWRIRLRNRSYLTTDTLRRNDHPEEPVHLLSFTLDRFFSDYFYLTGQAVGAYAGGAGGYAEGLLGAGVISGELFYGLRLFAEAVAGAAGGGGLATDGGSVVNPCAGISWMSGDDISLELSAGWIKALEGRMSTLVIEAGIGYRFAFVEKR